MAFTLPTILKRLKSAEPDTRVFNTCLGQLTSRNDALGAAAGKIVMRVPNGQEIKEQLLSLVRDYLKGGFSSVHDSKQTSASKPAIKTGMTPVELKKCREKIGADQKGMARLLGVAHRTYQNWEQGQGKKNHRQLPDEMAKKVRTLVSLKSESTPGARLPQDLQWVQLPFRPREIANLERLARVEGLNSVETMIRHIIMSYENY